MSSSLRILSLVICISSFVAAQQPYITSSYGSFGSPSGYSCNGLSKTCQAYLKYSVQSPYTTVSSVAMLFSVSPSNLAHINSVVITSSLAVNKNNPPNSSEFVSSSQPRAAAKSPPPSPPSSSSHRWDYFGGGVAAGPRPGSFSCLHPLGQRAAAVGGHAPGSISQLSGPGSGPSAQQAQARDLFIYAMGRGAFSCPLELGSRLCFVGWAAVSRWIKPAAAGCYGKRPGSCVLWKKAGQLKYISVGEQQRGLPGSKLKDFIIDNTK
ncbi:hypothetical protein Droror1_Dr00010658 [Drosera rotundifolia]